MNTELKPGAFVCPRRHGIPLIANYPKTDHWRSDDTCSYCGSLNPAVMMQHLRDKTAKLSVTTKNYKVYLQSDKPLFKRTYRTDSKPFAGWDSPEHNWVTEQTSHAKLYWEHFDRPQRIAFIDMLNNNEIGFVGGFAFGSGGPYPFFVTTAPAVSEVPNGG